MNTKKGSSPFLDPYHNFLAIAGALGLVNIFDYVVQWRGVFFGIVGVWQQWVRPAAEYLLSWVPYFFRIDIPPFAIDYLTVGVILTGGTIRAVIDSRTHVPASTIALLKTTEESEPLVNSLIRVILSLFAWPVWLIVIAFSIRQNFIDYNDQIASGKSREYWYQDQFTAFILLSPLIYFLLFLAMNWAIFFV